MAALFTFFALSLFDALIGGSISAILRIDGWTPIDQRLNDVYHVNYAIIVAAALLWHYAHFRLVAPVLAVVILFLGYVEDVLFYCLAPLLHPAIKMLTKGETLATSSGELLPQQISGWAGWLGRAVVGRNLAFSLSTIFAFNALAVFAALVLACLKCKAANRRNESSCNFSNYFANG